MYVLSQNKTFLSGEFVAQFKFTVLLMPNGPLKITGLPFEAELYESEKSVEDPELKVSIKLQDKWFLASSVFILL